jgi:O-acetyl-ADP-ribose deacetylase (regulator of RNase III)
MEVIMEVNIGRAKFSIVLGDITKSGMEAIANSANDKLWMGSGVAGAIKKHGGEEIELEAMKKGPIPIGEVAITGAGNLSAKKVIHAVVMGQDLKTSEEFVRNATRNTLIAAEKLPVSSLAMPAFGTGVGHFSAEDCSKIMVEETVNALLDAKNLTQVKIVLEDQGTFEIFKHALDSRFRRK